MSERYRKPQTIDELKRFCAEKNMPLERMRFFIGEDYPGARAFGIYEAEDGDYVVYKNKTNGERAVRYKGPNEAYAVNELYEKLKAETEQRRSAGSVTRQSQQERERRKRRLILIAAAVLLLISLYVAARTPNRGYYQYNGHSYFYDNSDWYGYDSYYDDWYPLDEVDPILESHSGDYYVSEDYDASYGAGDFRNSPYYDDSDFSSYDSDSDDYDWDSGWDDWDSFDTDWDSDW